MRGMDGKLITVWSPGLHGVGVSTAADAIGFALQYITNKKVLIMNNCCCLSYMERFLENDIRIKYTLDNLKIFNRNISTEHIFTYATAINERLYMISGSRLENEITKEDKDFGKLLLKKCLEAFDVVIADINTGIREENQLFLEKADSIMAVVTANEIMLDDMLKGTKDSVIKNYIFDDKTAVIFNKLFEGWNIDRELKGLNKKYGISSSFGLHYNGDVFDACCRRRQFYSFMMEELRSGKRDFSIQVTDICDYLIEKLYLGIEEEQSYKRRAFLSLFTV